MSTLWNDNDQQRLVRGLRSLAEDAPPYQQAADRPVRTATSKGRWRLSVAMPALATLAVVVGAVTIPLVLNEDGRGMDTTNEQTTGWAEPGPASPPPSADLPGPDVEAVRSAARPLATLEQQPGFGRVALDFDTKTVTVFWAGEPPQEVTTRLGTTSDGVRVDLVEVPYSQADLVAVGDRVLKGTGPGTGLPAAFLVRPRPDLSGVVVEMERTDLTQSQLAELESLAGVPVTVEPGEPLRPQ